MAKYYIEYGTGDGNEWVEGTLEEAMEIADKGVGYTQSGVEIQDEDGEPIVKRKWWGYEFDPETDPTDEDEIISFGSYGFCGPWEDVERW